MKKLKVGIIGAGQVAIASHIKNYKLCEEVELVSICDTNIQLAKKVALEFGIPNVYNNHMEMLEKVELDALSICVPNKYHCQIACDALKYAHVLCEKPPAITFLQAQQMQECAEKSKKILTYGFHLRHSTNTAILKQKILNNQLGNIYASEAIWVRKRGIPGWGNFTNKVIQGGGALIDIGVHMLDLAFYLLDYPEIKYVCATSYDLIGKKGGKGFFGEWSKEKFTVEDGMFAQIVFENNSTLHLKTTFALNIEEKEKKNVYLYGDKKGAMLFPLEVYGEEHGEFTKETFPFMSDENLHLKEITNFVNSCLNNQEILVKKEHGTYVQKAVELLYLSSNANMPVFSKELL